MPTLQVQLSRSRDTAGSVHYEVRLDHLCPRLRHTVHAITAALLLDRSHIDAGSKIHAQTYAVGSKPLHQILIEVGERRAAANHCRVTSCALHDMREFE